MLLQDGGLLDLSRKVVKEPSRMEMVARVKELGLPKGCGIRGFGGENIDSLSNGLVEFSNCLRMPTTGFEKEICTLFKKMELRKGRGMRISGGKKRFFSCFEREIRKLECLVNYNSSLFIARGKKSSAGA